MITELEIKLIIEKMQYIVSGIKQAVFEHGFLPEFKITFCLTCFKLTNEEYGLSLLEPFVMADTTDCVHSEEYKLIEENIDHENPTTQISSYYSAFQFVLQ